MQYAVIETGGKQYIATPGKELVIEKLPQAEGAIVFDKVLLVVDGDKVSLGQPYVSTPVSATIVEQRRGEKLNIIKYRSKSRYRRAMGHRQDETVVRIDSIGAAKKKAVVEEK